METKSLFVALVGRPNVGKSTLLNTILGEKVAIVSNKPQTTRNRITGILTRDDTQFVFMDTPGMHNPQTKLGNYMVNEIGQAVGETDIILYLVECGDRIGATEKMLMENFKKVKVPVILLVNKTDESNAVEIGETIKRFSEAYDYDSVVPISAKTGYNVDAVMDETKKFAMPSPWYFPSDIITSQPERVIASEIIREKVLQTVNKEIPHGTAVVIEEFKEEKNMISIRAEIFCEKPSHKPILIGKNGEKLKMIGSRAREDMERFFGVKVYINLWVKVKEKWRDSEVSIANFGYRTEK